MTFSNPTARPMEGDLYFPLPEGATISGYALDVGGVMVGWGGREKARGRGRVFEEVSDRGSTRGWSSGPRATTFQTPRVPHPGPRQPDGARAVRERVIGGKEAPAYHLPLKFKDKLPEFSLRVEVVKSAAPPKVAKGEPGQLRLREMARELPSPETKQQDWTAVRGPGHWPCRRWKGRRCWWRRRMMGRCNFAVQDIPGRAAFDVTKIHGSERVVVFLGCLRLAGRGPQAGDNSSARVP